MPLLICELLTSRRCLDCGQEEQIREKGRHGNKAREVTIFVARGLSEIKCKELGNFL